MDKKRKPLNNQQLTDVVDHEIRITKLETKKKKVIKKGGKGPKVTIADVMQALVQFQNSVDQRLDKIENRIDKLETYVDQRFDKIDQRLNDLSDRVVKIEKEIFKN